MEAPVKPLYPTSTGNVNALHPACEHTDLHTIAFSASIPSSHCQFFQDDQHSKSGPEHDVWPKRRCGDLGNNNWGSRSTLMFHSAQDERRDGGPMLLLWALTPYLANWIARCGVARLGLFASSLHTSMISASLCRTRLRHHL